VTATSLQKVRSPCCPGQSQCHSPGVRHKLVLKTFKKTHSKPKLSWTAKKTVLYIVIAVL